MKIAVEGCCHDQLDVIYDTIDYIEKQKGIKVDLLLICGDFQATRNPADLQCMAVPAKYKDMKYFWKYYKKEKKAPVLTIVIGGNHEASNHMQELPYGGWLAPNIYYLGYAGIVNVGGVRIGGMSGISKPKDYHKGHFERPPYNNDSLRSAYHVRSLEVFRLKQVKDHVSIMLSHDWPRGVVHGGNIEYLVSRKPDFRDEIVADEFSSIPGQEVLCHIKPTYWFSAHFHVKYSALVAHESKEGEAASTTKFLALDKCLPRREFLQVFDIPHTEESPFKIKLDAEWLCILKSTDHLLNISENPRYMPGIGCSDRYDFTVTEKEKSDLLADFGGDMTLPENFEQTVECYDGVSSIHKSKPPKCQVNPQTTLLCQMLGITDPNSVFCGTTTDPDEIQLDTEDDDEIAFEDDTSTSQQDVSATSGEHFPTFMNSTIDNSRFMDSSITSSTEDTGAKEIKECQNAEDKPAAPLTKLSLPEPSITESRKPSDIVTMMSVEDEKMQPESHTKTHTENQPHSSDDLQAESVMESSQESSQESRKRMSIEEHESADTKNPPTAEKILKKFKRRNVAMYSILTNQETDESV